MPVLRKCSLNIIKEIKEKQKYIFYHYLGFLTSSSVIKSLASSVISSNDSSPKSQFALVTLARVSASWSPRNGDSPDNLQDITYVR